MQHRRDWRPASRVNGESLTVVCLFTHLSNIGVVALQAMTFPASIFLEKYVAMYDSDTDSCVVGHILFDEPR